MKTPTDNFRYREAKRRLDLVTICKSLLSQGFSKKEASKQIGESATSLTRYLNAFDAHGFDGLLPKTDRCGRVTPQPSGFDKHVRPLLGGQGR